MKKIISFILLFFCCNMCFSSPMQNQVMKRKVALITGGGSGLGQAFAKELASQEYEIFILGRTESSLKSTCELLFKRCEDIISIVEQIFQFISKMIYKIRPGRRYPRVECSPSTLYEWLKRRKLSSN